MSGLYQLGLMMLCLMVISCAPAEDHTPEQSCNGSVEYCQRPYNQLAQICSHNAMSNTADGFFLPRPNQAYTIVQQLDDGVRCLMLDTFEFEGELRACHEVCALGSRPLVQVFAEIGSWLEAHPDEVVTLILEAYISQEQTLTALQGAGLGPGEDDDAMLYSHNGPPGTPWPTLGAIIASGRRLVMLSDEGGADGGWYLDWKAYGWETRFNEVDLSCESGRGTPGAHANELFLLNHYRLCELGGCEENSLVNNSYDFFLSRAMGCWAQDEIKNPYGQIPTFLVVDHYHLPKPGGHSPRPDPFDVVDALNAAWPGPPSPSSSTERAPE